MHDQVSESISLAVPQIMSAVTAVGEKFHRSTSQALHLQDGHAVVEVGNIGAEATDIEVYNRVAYASCVASAQRPHESEQEAIRRLYAHLQTVAITVKSELFDIDEFVKAAGKKPTKATHASPYQKVIQLADLGVSKSVASKQGAALEWVLSQCESATNVAAYFENAGGISKCYKKSLEAKQSAEAQGQVSPRRRIVRPDEAARLQGIPVIGLPVGVNGDFTFVIRLANGCGEVIATVSADTGDRHGVQPLSPYASSEVATQSATSSSDDRGEGASAGNLGESAVEQNTTAANISQSPAEPESEQSSGAGDAADSAAQDQTDETQTEKDIT